MGFFASAAHGFIEQGFAAAPILQGLCCMLQGLLPIEHGLHGLCFFIDFIAHGLHGLCAFIEHGLHGLCFIEQGLQGFAA